MPIYKRGVDEGLDSDCGQLFTKNYSIIKTGFTFVFSSLTCKLLFLLHLTLNKSSFPGIIFLRIIIIYIMFLTENIFFFHKLVNSYSKFYLQVDLTISPFQSDRGTLQELVLKNFPISMSESLFNRVPGLRVYNFIKRRQQHGCFPVNFAKFFRTPILKNLCKRLPLVCDTSN